MDQLLTNQALKQLYRTNEITIIMKVQKTI